MFTKCVLRLLTTLLVVATVQASQVLTSEENGVKSAVYLSPKFVLGAGSVANKIYHNIDFPKGHVALKEFSAEVVDELGNPVPLHETYLHHWLISRYYALIDDNGDRELKVIPLRNSGVCKDTLGQYYGLGSETRRTDTYVPDPYGIEIGNQADIPDGYVERWELNVHAIDTRGAVDKLGCTECKCDLYNITKDEDGQPLRKDYIGGLLCCYDQTQCRVREGFENVLRGLYLRYTVKWIDWVDTILPVKIYILDVTDTTEREDTRGGCMIEYEVKSCGISGVLSNGCLDSKKTRIVMQKGGYVVYGVAHQHSGGTGSALYGEREVDVGIVSEDGKQLRPADLMVYGWTNDRDTCIDFVGSSPFTDDIDRFVVGRCVSDAVVRKNCKYNSICQSKGYEFAPFSFSSLGELDQGAVDFLKRTQHFSLSHNGGAKLAMHMFARVGFSIHKGVGAQLVSRLPSNFL